MRMITPAAEQEYRQCTLQPSVRAVTESAHALGRAEVVFISFFHSNNLKTHISKGDTKAWQKTSVGFGILKSRQFCHCCHTHFLTDFFYNF